MSNLLDDSNIFLHTIILSYQFVDTIVDIKLISKRRSTSSPRLEYVIIFNNIKLLEQCYYYTIKEN